MNATVAQHTSYSGCGGGGFRMFVVLDWKLLRLRPRTRARGTVLRRIGAAYIVHTIGKKATEPQWMEWCRARRGRGPVSGQDFFFITAQGDSQGWGRDEESCTWWESVLEDLYPCERLSIDRRLPKMHGPTVIPVTSAVRCRAAHLTSPLLPFRLAPFSFSSSSLSQHRLAPLSCHNKPRVTEARSILSALL